MDKKISKCDSHALFIALKRNPVYTSINYCEWENNKWLKT
jgi:hypothetical protein